MEKIIIKNFLIFDDVEMEIKRLNILIGEQASGKSLLAKLVYFFRRLQDIVMWSIHNDDNFEELIKQQKELFIDLFPPNLWNKNNSFKISYFYSDKLIVEVIADDKKAQLIDISYPQLFQDSYLSIKENFKSKKSYQEDNIFINQLSNTFLTEANKDFKQRGFEAFFKHSSYIPAGRSFFSMLEKNAFSLMANDNLEIDPLMRDFGISFQRAKRFTLENIIDNQAQLNKQEILNFYEKVLKSRYEIIDNKDYLTNKQNGQIVTLSRASSGQQEAFPLVLMLGMLLGKNIRQVIHYLFIEEPEAHLFPTSQNTIVSAVLNSLYLSNDEYCQRKGDIGHIFITTHSPYILSAINNAILADDMVKKGKLTVEEYVKMSDGAYPISLDDVSAYSMSGGKITNIKDEDYRMIGGEILDEVSNHFGEVMDQLLELDNNG